jgi:transposase
VSAIHGYANCSYKVAMVAFAAKTARIIWAMLVKGEPYRNRVSAPAAA